ncbi:hypothetical protein [Texcoconibacillus texcoconensis]|uniref:Uncharacterized protein n=1 Tax=Texcoconibacillus texcoconensis TaxID=1095777 RepID=A0A840QUN9_9BACI|nr:hypothetical protein [Texcoconibacillus texcoconensis]MBB5175060.1 hypothetical protein [Texcoconibacillus texcoconensis]
MYVGRDMTELSMTKKTDWTEKELANAQHMLQQMLPYLNAEGVTMQKEIMQEMMNRDSFHHHEADDTHGSRVHFE